MRAPRSRTLYSLVRAQAECFPERIAVICGKRQATYRALADAAGRIATGLRASGFGRGDRVGILIENRLEWLECCFGAAEIGATVVPFSTWSKPQELAYLLADAEIGALFAVNSFAGQNFAEALTSLIPEANGAPSGQWRSREFPRLRHIVILGGTLAPGWTAFDNFAAADACASGEMARSEDDALILYTSGSSARSKAVRLQHYGVIEHGFDIGERMGLGPDDRVLLAPPLL